MNINTLLDNLAQAIADDQDLQAWCQVNYGKVHQVSVAYAGYLPGDEIQCPLVVIYPVSKAVGQDLSEKQHRFGIECNLFGTAEVTYASDNIRKIKTVEDVESFRKLVEQAVLEADVGRCVFTRMEIAYQVSLAEQEIVRATMDINLNEANIMGTSMWD